MADDYSINAKITADASGFKKGVNEAQKASQSLSKSVSGMIQGLGKSGLVGALGAVGLATGGVTAVLGVAKKTFQAVSKVVNECSEAYRKQYQAEIGLETAVKNSPYIDGSATRALKSFASEMQSISNIGDEEVLPMMTKLIASGRTQAETMNIIKVATDMSADGTISFETAITQLNATLNGNIGRLGLQYGELKNLTEEELRNGKAVEILGAKYEGLAESTADSNKQLKNALGDLKENLGASFEKALSPMRKYFTEVVTNLNNAISKSRELKGAVKEVFSDDGVNVDASTNNLQIAFNEALAKQREVTQNQKQYLELYGAYINKTTDEVYLSYQNQISELNKQIKDISEELNKRKRESDAQAKARKEAEEQAEAEKKINDLKQKYLEKIAEQEAKWNNIKIVTGEAVKNEEKLKFYQEQLVAIMTESGGAITKNNQYYKDQKKIIEDLVKLIQEEGGSIEDLGDVTEVTKTKFQIFFDELSKELKASQKTLKDYVKMASSALGKMFETLGKELVEGSVSWKSYAKIAVESIAEVLKSLAAQLSAMAVARIANYDYATAAVAAAGATAALIASGALSQVAKGLDNVKESADNAGKSVEQFKESLQNIDTSFTRSSSDVLQTIRKYNEEYKQLKATADSAYDAYWEANQKAGEAFSKYYSELQRLGYKRSDGSYYLVGSALSYVNSLEEEYNKLNSQANSLYSQYKQLNNLAKQAKTAMKNAGKEVIENYKKQADSVSETVSAYKELYSSAKDYKSLLERWNLYSSKSQATLILESLFGENNLYKQLKEAETYYEILFQEQRSNVSKIVSNLYGEITQTGKKIGETLVSSIVSGASKADFMGQMKDYIRQTLIQLTVYTESFQEQLAEIGNSLSSALIVGNKVNLRNVKKQIESLYDNAVKKAKEAEDVISYVFRDLGATVEESISDFGQNIANTLIDSLSNGLDQSNFLDSIKKWIRKMLIQTVVYTKAMKSEIEAIGNAISKGLSEGFTDTTLHEIRRDLSWVFEQANKTITNIDDVLNSVFSGYATGTNNALSGLHLVGEAGPELVRFKGGEQVLNNRNTQKALSGMNGTTINQNVTFNNLADTTAFAMMNQLKQYNRQMAINGVI